jgi:hypothetical protein
MILCKFCGQYPITGNQKVYCGDFCYKEAKKERERHRRTPPKPFSLIRECMRCERQFTSDHRFNRLCERCKHSFEHMVPLNGCY